MSIKQIDLRNHADILCHIFYKYILKLHLFPIAHIDDVITTIRLSFMFPSGTLFLKKKKIIEERIRTKT